MPYYITHRKGEKNLVANSLFRRESNTEALQPRLIFLQNASLGKAKEKDYQFYYVVARLEEKNRQLLYKRRKMAKRQN